MGVEVELPEFGAGCLAMAAEENGVVAGENSDCCFSNRTRQSWSHRGPIPSKLCLKLGIMWAVGVGRLERRMSQAAEDKWGAPVAVPTMILSALGFTLAQGTFGVK